MSAAYIQYDWSLMLQDPPLDYKLENPSFASLLHQRSRPVRKCTFSNLSLTENTIYCSNWCTQLYNHRNVKNKIPTIALTCFGSRRNHHQGALLCLAKTTIMILLCSLLMKWSVLVLAKHEIAPWWWFLREPKHVGAIVRILIVFSILMIL